jgi:SET domain-containing protein
VADPDVEVRASDIAGRGLFAAADLPAGTVVLRLAASPVAHRVDGLGADFPNHSCDPNLGWLDELGLATMVDVTEGEELVTDYAMAIAEPDWFLRCHCPSYRCRQMVEGTDWRIPQLQQRYAGWWAPHVATAT